MESTLPLVDESRSTRASCLPRSAFRSRFKRRWDAICSCLTSAMEFIQFGNGLALEPMPSHLKIGNAVEMIEDDGRTFVKAIIEDICLGNGTLLVKSSCDESDDNFILLQKDKVRPLQASSVSPEHHGRGPHPNFTIYDHVDVLISGKWMTGVVVQSPTSNEDNYHVRIFREKEKFDLTVPVTTKVRLHFDWDRLRGWNYHGNESNNHPLNQVVGLVGHHRAKIVKMLDADHAIVEYSDLTNLDGINVQEVIHINDWYKSRWRRGLKEMRYWLAPSNDPVREFECYMPVYSCLAMLAAVSQVLFASSAENWPDDMLLYFYALGGLCCFLSTSLVVGVMCWQPTTRAVLRVWRVMCLICVAIGVSFLAVHAVYGRQALMASRVKPPSNVLSA